MLGGVGALAAAGWVGGFSSGWLLRPRWAHAEGPIKMGIATDITGPISPAGNADWQVAQLTVEQINAGGGILGRPIELYLEDTASDPKIAVGNVRRLILDRKVNVVLGGITSAMRQAIKDPIVRRGRTLYIYPQLYEGQECTKYLFCTGPTPAQQCDRLLPYLIKEKGRKRFAMPSANYVWPQLLAGALYTYHQGFIGPGNMGPGLSTLAVIYCLFGGAGTLIGPVLGTVAIEVLSFWLGDIDAIKQFWPIILGVILLIVVMVQPGGLLGVCVTARERFGFFGWRRR